MSEILKVLQESIAISKSTNEKLSVLTQLGGTFNLGKIEIKDGSNLKTIYSNGSTVTIASYPKLGMCTPSHCHTCITEYLICTKGSVSVSFNGGYRIMKAKECASIPEGAMHITTALEDDSELIAVCVPAEPSYTASMACK